LGRGEEPTQKKGTGIRKTRPREAEKELTLPPKFALQGELEA